MKRFLIILLGAATLSLVSCGKNEVFSPIAPQPYQPINQAPMPPGYGGYPGSGYGYPGGGYGYPSGGYGYPGYGYPGGFNPQMPNGYPSSYTPFLPIDNFMRNNPQLSGYWPQFWNQWRNHCNQQGWSPYDFNRFWFEYCPQQWRNGSMLEIYVYVDQNFYYWADPYTRYSNQMSPSSFWQYYQGYGYGDLNSLYY